MFSIVDDLSIDTTLVSIVIIVHTTTAVSTCVRIAQRPHMMRMVRRTGNIANSRNLAKPLSHILNFQNYYRLSEELKVVLLALDVWHWHPGTVQILGEECHEDNCPELEGLYYSGRIQHF